MDRKRREVAPIKEAFLKPKTQKIFVEDSPHEVISVRRKTKKQLKRERKKSEEKKLCRSYLEGKCEIDNCKFSHNVEEYLRDKPPCIKWKCPSLSNGADCPYGVTCRMDHENQYDPLSKIEDVLHLRNVFSPQLRTSLRKGDYDYCLSDAVLAKQGILNPPVGEFEEVPLRQEEKTKVDFSGKLYLAPLTTLGNLPFRRMCIDYGADVTCSEMALATNLLQGQQTEWALLKRHPSETIFGVQLCGGYADSLTRCSQLIEDNCEVDFIDLNLGCPIDAICHRSAGSNLLLKPKKIETIAKAMSIVMTSPLTVKMRKGYNDNEDVVHSFIPQLSSWGVSAVTLHGRSRAQRYTKLCDWEYIYSCSQLKGDLQFIGNGDILSSTEWEERLHASEGSLTTCMIGRGALMKPWLFTEIKERRHWDISASERLEMLKTFCSRGLEHWGSDHRGVETTRRFLLEWLSFLYRYIPVGILEVVPQEIYSRPPPSFGRNDLETLFMSDSAESWVKISEMMLGSVPDGFTFCPKHKSNAYTTESL